MTKKPELTLLYTIARSYYIDKLSQSQIAEMENISRSQISRLLDRAEKLGIVNIDVSLPEDPDLSEMAESVTKLLGLREVIVAPLDGGADDPAAIAEAISVAAAQYLPRALKGTKTVGLGWGKTMYNMSLRLSYRNLGDERVYVPLVGMSGTSNPYLQINTIVDRVAERHRARSYFVSVPAFRELSSPFSEIEEQRMATLEQYWAHLDAAVIGLGRPPQSGGLFVDEISERCSAEVASCGAVGDILSYFFHPNGSMYHFGHAYRQVAFDIRRLHRVRKVICLAGGPDKIEGIAAAARLKYFNSLVTDSVTAKTFYDQFRSGGVDRS
ncbi:MAG TPA: sugar-binding domain-containing protein [Clostridia bacterium]|nr:sugar-binding domain-containing protein [Clostridia bacterium]